MRFAEIFRFELKYHLSRPATWIYIGVVLSFNIFATVSLIENVQEGDYYLNSPVTVSLIAAVSSMFGLLLAAALCGNSAVRDHQTGIETLLYTTSLKKFSYIGARFLAVLSINFGVLITTLLFLLTVSQIPVTSGIFGPDYFHSYANALIFFVLPNTFIITSFLYAISLTTKKSMAAFLAAAVLFIVAFFAMDILAGELGKWAIAKKLDFTGITFLKELRAIQTPLELKSAMVTGDVGLYLNRISWLAVSFLTFCWAYWKFRLELETGRRKRDRKRHLQSFVSPPKILTAGISIPAIPRTFNLKTNLQQLTYLSFQSFKNMLKGMVWLIYPVTAAISIIASEEVIQGQLGVPVIPTTITALNFLKAMGTSLVLSILITYYSGSLIWKERDAGLNDIQDASPAPNWTLYLSKFVSLVMMLLFMQVLVMITGLIVQILLNSSSIDVSLYLKVLFGLRLIDLILFGVVAFLIHVLVNQKYVGHLTVIVLFLYMYFPGLFNLQHNLLIFGRAPEWSYSNMSSFAGTIGPWLWFKLYWSAWAVVLAFVTSLFWIRGRENKIQQRSAQAKLGISGKTAKIGFPLLLSIFLLGGFIFYNTNILNTYNSLSDHKERQAIYEKRYGQYENTPQPILSEVKLHVELYPEEHEAEIKGIYKLVNHTNKPIDTILISTTSDVDPGKLVFSRKTSVIKVDKEVGQRIYKLSKPLIGEDSLQLMFTAKFEQKGFKNSGLEKSIVANGTYFGHHLLPSIGYQEIRELSDEKDRKKFDLKPKRDVASLYDKRKIFELSDREKIHFEAILGTSLNEVAITAGNLKTAWVENNRSYYHYRTDVPINHNYEILSAEYKLYEDHWKDVKVQIYYHPTHSRNLERMAEAIKTSLAYFSKEFKPYPHKQIKLVEFPGDGTSLNGNPVTMTYSEGFSSFAPEKDLREVDFPFAVVAHEVAHQWWGNELRPAHVQGAPILTESLAWYSSWMLVEETFGEEHLKNLLEVMRQEYLSPRSTAALPLIESTEPFSYYRKGPFALYSIQEYIGKEKVNLALHRLIQKFQTNEPPLPTTLDLYSELQQVTPDSLQYLLKDLMAENTFWDIEASSAKALHLENDNYEIIISPSVKKTRVDIKGNISPVPVRDYIELAVYAATDGEEQAELLKIQKQLITSTEQVKITVSKKPGLVVIDPNQLLIDRDISNNSVEVTIEED